MDDVLKGRLLFPKSCLKFPSCAEPLPVLDEQSSKLEPLPVRWVFSSKVGPPPFPHPATTLSTGMYSLALGPLRSRGGSLFRPLPISSFQLLPPACLCPSGLLVPCTPTGSTTSVSCEGSIERVTSNCYVEGVLSWSGLFRNGGFVSRYSTLYLVFFHLTEFNTSEEGKKYLAIKTGACVHSFPTKHLAKQYLTHSTVKIHQKIWMLHVPPAGRDC